MMTRLLCLFIIAGLLKASPAAVTYNLAESVYHQDFNSLANSGDTHAWVNDQTLSGWHWRLSDAPPTGFYTPNNYAVNNGGTPKQSTPLSLGSAGAMDRALGGQNGNIGGQEIIYGFSLSNQTGGALRQFTLGYTGEQWRAISNAALYGPGTLKVQYQVVNVGAGSLQASSGWITASDLQYTAAYVPTTNTQVNGNDANYRSVISATISGVLWNAGQELWIRWVDDHPVPDNANYATLSMIGIDDVSFSASAVPEPQRGLLVALALFACFIRRSR